MAKSESEQVWLRSVQQLQDDCKSKLKNTTDESLMKCQKLCTELSSLPPLRPSPDISRSEDKQALCKWIRLYAQAVFDFTFYDENKLVDEDFPASSCKERMQVIQQYLRKPEELLATVPDADVRDLLGEDLVECGRWRQGALNYMYCCTVNGIPGRVPQEKDHFLQCAKDGACLLQKMLSVRLPVARQDFSYHDPQALALLKQGAYSDTHVIAMMYAGELCHWYCEHATQESSQGQSFNAGSVGRSMLNAYLGVIQGPLKGQGWQADRAKMLLGSLPKDETSE